MSGAKVTDLATYRRTRCTHTERSVCVPWSVHRHWLYVSSDAQQLRSAIRGRGFDRALLDELTDDELARLIQMVSAHHLADRRLF